MYHVIFHHHMKYFFHKIHFQNVLYTTPCLFRNDINGQNVRCYVRWRMASFYHFQVCFMTTRICWIMSRDSLLYKLITSQTQFGTNSELLFWPNEFETVTKFDAVNNDRLFVRNFKIIAYANGRFIVSSVFKVVRVSIALPWCSSWCCTDIIVLEFVRLVIRTNVKHMQIGMVPPLDYVPLNHRPLQNDICIAELAHRSG